jgi:hypothetical protein
MNATARGRDDSIYDPDGTSHAFNQLEFYACVLACNFEEQITGAPARLLEQWRWPHRCERRRRPDETRVAATDLRSGRQPIHSKEDNMNAPSSLSAQLDSLPEGWRPKPGEKADRDRDRTRVATTDYGEYPIVTVRTDDGADFAFHAYHTVARSELEKQKPKVGDLIGIAHHGPHPARGYERYRIVIPTGAGGAGIDTPAAQSSTDQDTNLRSFDDDIPY